MQICIKSTPQGSEPEEIRRRWIGCVLDTTGRERPHPAANPGGYVVTAHEALRVLASHDIVAHRFWDRALPDDARLVFAADVCEEVVPV